MGTVKYKITDQQAVNYVVKFMRKQGKPSVTQVAGFPPVCVNVAEDGSRCAIGCMFTKKSQVNWSAEELRRIATTWGVSDYLVGMLVMAHDYAANVGNFVEGFERTLRVNLPSHITLPK